MVLAEEKNNTNQHRATTSALDPLSKRWVVMTSCSRRRAFGSNRITHFCECHRAVHIRESAISRTSYHSRQSFIHSFSTDSVEKWQADFAEELARVQRRAIFQSIDKFQARPNLIDRANLHVYQAGGQTNIAYDIFREVCLHTRCFLWPRHPEHSVWFYFERVPRECSSKNSLTLYKEQNEIEVVAFRMRAHAHV